MSFHGPEIENFLIILGDMRRPAAANADVIDPARLFPAEFDIAFAHVGHAFLRKIELIAVRIVAAQAGERHVALALRECRRRDNIALMRSRTSLHIFDGKAEMIQARSETGLALQAMPGR